MDRPVVAVVLAGGVGSRLYPASRGDRPKQFLSLDGEASLLARTVERASFADETLVVTRPEFAEAAREHAPDAEVLVEPAGRDTGPALVYATHVARERFDGPVVLALPSDHHVAGPFERTVRRGLRLAAETGALVTFGVEPTRAETGYGYVEPGPARGAGFDVAAFHEKPDAETAAAYVDAGHLWNAGIFAWTPAAFLAAARDSPLSPLVDALEAPDPDPEAGFAAVAAESVDDAVLERAADVVVVPVDFAWDDLGTWDALERLEGASLGGDVLTLDAEGNVVAAPGRHVSLVGVSDLVVAAFDDRVLVVPKSEAGRVREVVDRLRDEDLF